jgi:hypothetical protein
MTTFSTYIHQSVGDAALHGAIQGLFVTLLFSTAAGFLGFAASGDNGLLTIS